MSDEKATCDDLSPPRPISCFQPSIHPPSPLPHLLIPSLSNPEHRELCGTCSLFESTSNMLYTICICSFMYARYDLTYREYIRCAHRLPVGTRDLLSHWLQATGVRIQYVIHSKHNGKAMEKHQKII